MYIKTYTLLIYTIIAGEQTIYELRFAREEYEDNYESYNIFGAHLYNKDGISGVRFLVYAPHALSVSVVGNFNNWNEFEKAPAGIMKEFNEIFSKHGLYYEPVYNWMITGREIE